MFGTLYSLLPDGHLFFKDWLHSNYISKYCNFSLLPPPLAVFSLGENEHTATLITEAQRLTFNPAPETETDLRNQRVSCLIIIGAWLVCQRPDTLQLTSTVPLRINDPRHMRTVFTCRTPYRHIEGITVGIFSGTYGLYFWLDCSVSLDVAQRHGSISGWCIESYGPGVFTWGWWDGWLEGGAVPLNCSHMFAKDVELNEAVWSARL